MYRVIYDLQFSELEKRQIHRLRRLDANKKFISWSSGVASAIAVFAIQIPFHGITWLHALSSYGCIPAGIVVGFSLNRLIDWFVENRFRLKWDPLYYQRAGTNPDIEAARDEILRVTDQPWFYGLDESEQRAIMDKINRKYGI